MHVVRRNTPVKTVGEASKTGTMVTFLPDRTIFKQTIEYNYETLANRMRELSFLNKGIKNPTH
jgi:DNA gyrase subunit B